MSLQTFSQQKTGIKPTMIGDSMIENFDRSVFQKTQRQNFTMKAEPKKQTKWQWISKQLMKPVGIVAAETENVGHFFGGLKAQTPGKAGLDILAGKREYSFSQMWRENAAGIGLSENTAGKIGFVMDITNDPFNFIGGGLTKLGKLSTKVNSLQKSGKTIVKGSKLANQISKSGYTFKELTLAGTKAEQVVAKQRALIKIAGKPVVGGEKVYKAASKLSKMMGASKVGVGLRRTFSTKTGIKTVDEMVSNFNNLTNYRKELVLDNAVKIQKQVNKMKPDDVKLLVEAIENPIAKGLVKDKKIISLADKMEDLFKQMKTAEKGKGILKTEIEQYFPHIKAKTKIGERISAFFQPKK
ncbi:hypothetical protein GQ568_00730, partial [Patescibacteria group bacterium]|nr:hypothetical protein [Patescibacteria group bacterium]